MHAFSNRRYACNTHIKDTLTNIKNSNSCATTFQSNMSMSSKDKMNTSSITADTIKYLNNNIKLLDTAVNIESIINLNNIKCHNFKNTKN